MIAPHDQMHSVSVKVKDNNDKSHSASMTFRLVSAR